MRPSFGADSATAHALQMIVADCGGGSQSAINVVLMDN